ncbi:hypothetical protein J5X84_30250 [Streptosporangiaceae bacterium NEAU-GS5]|nr:hypothetical protein [Streptosporangiaceae bacterium NEAU-GS5]
MADEQFFTPGASGVRQQVERRSGTLLVFLAQLPRWVLPVAVVLLLLGSLALPPALGALSAAVLLVFVCWLAYLSWPSLSPGAKLLRAGVVVFVVLVALSRLGVI